MYLRILLSIAASLGLGIAGASTAVAVGLPDRCSAYVAASAPVETDQPAVIPLSLLEDQDTAIACLIFVIKAVKSDISTDGIAKVASARLLSVTAAFRTVIAKLVAADKTANTTTNLDQFIKEFRAQDDIETISVLAYGTRAENSDLRLNSLIILGNVIDNTSVCVALAHLNDPSLLSHPNGVNGRANLLGAVSVVAPWAYRENYDNISRTVEAIQGDVTNEHDPATLKYTLAKLDNIQERLRSQKPNSNKSVPLPATLRKNCRSYVENFLPKIVRVENVRYGP